MRQAAFLFPLPLAPLCLVAVTGCTQAQITRSAASVLSSVILTGGSSSTTRTTSSGRTPPPSANRVLGTAEQYIGVPYKWGGTSPETGFDCSGFVRYVYAKQGVRLPRTSREQAGAGQGVAARTSALRAGDLMLFAESREPISHVAIYAGDGWFIHSSSSGRGVRYDELDSERGQWYVEHMVVARRLAVDGRSLVQALELLSRPNLPLDPPDHAPPPR
jgi:cell wall-associated NlpC family hydrolase